MALPAGFAPPPAVKSIPCEKWRLVVAGVFGEAWASKELASINSQLRSKTSELRADSDQLLILITEQTGDAVQNSTRARRLADEAKETLERIKAPRSLKNSQLAVARLSEFKGTVYFFRTVFQDADSANLLSSIDNVLQKSGWIGVVDIRRAGSGMFFKRGQEELTAAIGYNEGVQIVVESPDGENILRSRKWADEPEYIRAAENLRSILARSIEPKTKRGVWPSLIVEEGAAVAVEIKVGSKPLE
jgi:hypothetical protein